jgi:MFS family permease
MDHAGAVIGPALASLFLWFYPEHYRTLFALTIIPGAIAVALILFIRERSAEGDSPAERKARRSSRAIDPSAGGLPREFNAFMLVLTLFTLGNSTDAFLLLRLTDVAGSARFVPLMWAGLHVVKAAVSVVGGSWSDRVGRRTVIAIGWLTYAVVYAGFAMSTTLPALLEWFFLYGFYFGFAEGTEKALVADLTPADRRGFAFGVYNAVQGLGGLAASVVFGLVWKSYGAPAAFGLGATLAVTATAMLFLAVPKTQAV